MRKLKAIALSGVLLAGGLTLADSADSCSTSSVWPWVEAVSLAGRPPSVGHDRKLSG